MHTLYTNQELISRVIDMQLEYGGYSCVQFTVLFGITDLFYVCDLKWKYAVYTEANPEGGFTHLIESGSWEVGCGKTVPPWPAQRSYYADLSDRVPAPVSGVAN